MTKPAPIRIGANIGWLSDNPPRANDIIPRIIRDTDAIFDICKSEKRVTIPAKISMIPII